METPPTPAEAAADLHRAVEAEARARSNSGWTPTYLAAFGAGFGAVTVAVGLSPSVAAIAAVIGLWSVFVALLAGWAVRQPATRRGAARRALPSWGLTAALYGIALAVGLPWRAGDATYWLPAAALVASPLLLAAGRERWR